MRRSETPLPIFRQRGFTYLWLLFAVAMLSLLGATAAQLESTLVQRDKELQLMAIGKQFRNAIARHYEIDSGNGRGKEYPASLAQLLRDDRAAGVRRHLRRIFVDPMTGKAEWGLVLRGGRIVGVHSLSEQMPIKQTQFDSEDAGFEGKSRYADWVFAYPADVMLKADSGGTSPSSAVGGVPLPSRGTRQ